MSENSRIIFCSFNLRTAIVPYLLSFLAAQREIMEIPSPF
jgi:hypothetical protein